MGSRPHQTPLRGPTGGDPRVHRQRSSVGRWTLGRCAAATGTARPPAPDRRRAAALRTGSGGERARRAGRRLSDAQRSSARRDCPPPGRPRRPRKPKELRPGQPSDAYRLTLDRQGAPGPSPGRPRRVPPTPSGRVRPRDGSSRCNTASGTGIPPGGAPEGTEPAVAESTCGCIRLLGWVRADDLVSPPAHGEGALSVRGRGGPTPGPTRQDGPAGWAEATLPSAHRKAYSCSCIVWGGGAWRSRRANSRTTPITCWPAS